MGAFEGGPGMKMGWGDAEGELWRLSKQQSCRRAQKQHGVTQGIEIEKVVCVCNAKTTSHVTRNQGD